jgi:tetratricopeptide (TPR) repeat protein
MALLAPYVGTGWEEAAETAAGFLAGEGRADDVFALLGPRVGDSYHARALIRLAEGLGRDEEVLELLPVVSPDHRAPHHAVELRARILERQGRVDDALLFLRAQIDGGRAVSVNHVEQAADILIRHGRLAGVRDLAAGRGGEYAAMRLAVSLAARGETDEALAELSPFIDGGSLNAAALAARLLAEAGRADEALEVLRLASAAHGNPDGVVEMLADLLAGQGRTDEALALADGLAGHPHWTPDMVLMLRVRALAASGQRDQAIAEIRSHPNVGEWWVACPLAGLLAENGQPEDAIAVLRQPGCTEGGNRTFLAELLAQEGRVQEAIAASHVRSPRA